MGTGAESTPSPEINPQVIDENGEQKVVDQYGQQLVVRTAKGSSRYKHHPCPDAVNRGDPVPKCNETLPSPETQYVFDRLKQMQGFNKRCSFCWSSSNYRSNQRSGGSKSHYFAVCDADPDNTGKGSNGGESE
jgi:hypothetical protein